MMALSGSFFIALMFMMGGQTGLPLGMPPGPEDPVMSQFAPAECLFYTAWSSSVAPDPSADTVTERWMARPEIQESFHKLKSAIKTMADTGEDDERVFGAIAFKVAERCLTNACAFYVSDFKTVDFSFQVEGGALITLGADAAEINEQLSAQLEKIFAGEEVTVSMKDIAGSSFRQVVLEQGEAKNVLTWGVVQNKYLALAVGENEMQTLLANIDTDTPQWLSDLQGEIPVDRTSAVTSLNVESIFDLIRKSAGDAGAGPEFDSALELMGLANIKTAGWISGLDDQGFICRGSVQLDGEPKGALALFEGEPLQPEPFGKIANDRMLMTGMRISIPRIFSLIRDVNDMNDWSRGQFDEGVNALNGMLDIDLEEDVINTLDDHAYVYGSINFANPTAGWVLGIGASQQMELTDTYNKITEVIKSQCEAGDDMEFDESDVNGTIIYSMEDTRGWGMPNFSWTLADGELLISMDKSSLRRHLRRDSMADDAMVKDPWFSENGFAQPRMDANGPLLVASVDFSSLLKMGVPLLGVMGDEMFPPGFNFSFDDLPSVDALTKDMKPNITAFYRTPEGFEIMQRQTYPGGTPGTLLGTTVIGLAPATMQVRSAAQRTDSANRMRQLLLAMHNYHAANRAFPARFSKDDEDKPLLSWRVHILPYMEENDLYEEFHLDEPWDSEHNKALVEKMPQCYVHPRANPEAGKTVYVVPQGEGSAMTDPEESGKPKGMRLEDISDGTSRTGVIFEANVNNAVVWTKPDDFDWKNIEDPVAALFGDWAGDGVNVALADGSVQFVSHDKLREVLDKLITTDDGEVVDLWSDPPLRAADDVMEGKVEMDRRPTERVEKKKQ